MCAISSKALVYCECFNGFRLGCHSGDAAAAPGPRLVT